jgi:two-component system sensor histidine kinase MtrB
MNSLVEGNEGAGAFEVLLLDGSEPAQEPLPERGTNLVEVSSVPPDVRARVRLQGQEVWTYTMVDYVDEPSQPGLVVGAPLPVGGESTYEVYYLFPFGELQRTLDLVRSTAGIAGVLLVTLLALLMALVSRHVVLPVRQAARAAELVRAGHLEQRLPVRGEDDLAELASAFNEMAQSLQKQIRQLEDLSRLQQRFVSDVSHELRTPLTTIRMASDVLHAERDSMPASLRRSAELLHQQLDRFESLLIDLLEISRFDAGAAHLETESVDLRRLVEAAVASAEPLARTRGSSVTVSAPDAPVVAACDPRRIERIMRNLLDNAIEHGEGGPIEVRVGGSDTAAAVSVRDHGRGLDDADLDRVFDRFWRADPARARTLGGTGLGLSIALEDTRLHGGRLSVWGRPGEGAIFRLTIPRVAGQPLTGKSPIPLDPAEASA